MINRCSHNSSRPGSRPDASKTRPGRHRSSSRSRPGASRTRPGDQERDRIDRVQTQDHDVKSRISPVTGTQIIFKTKGDNQVVNLGADIEIQEKITRDHHLGQEIKIKEE